MKSYRSKQFRKLYAQLPISIQEQAQAAYKILKPIRITLACILSRFEQMPLSTPSASVEAIVQ